MRAWLLLVVALAAQADERRSGRDTMSPALRTLQADEAQHPAELALALGRELWAQGARSCASCHGEPATLRGAATRYPVFDQGLIDLPGRIQRCRVQHQRRPAWAPEAEPLLALAALVARQSRGLPLQPPQGAELDAVAAQGQRLFTTRVGALNLACAQCHDERAGQRLGGSLIPQAHVDDYPVYRLEWQAVGSLQRRLRGCLAGVRARVWDWDGAELLALEVYLARRSAGMTMQPPGVRP
ncbi:sulfur oxidation c-type cytochrome SoxA [Roseateles saccharophilus]|uniref:L-cysteine S-thiosulfotransferase subunit SoxA n=1 Tax=Roseateles saccharophilus TaxID=304 RepID=A0A4R3UJ73_ROSSA|nr:sulfur oxidation c-type cytochrome SoxA [Roseateles saccharophilus]MDG0834936.1 sulfur oxidation c-type cytochrome SoxA [Roseateles saccharophilus]TCU88350.1 sulfur-oxidizing protein SoxA [Roseateles saccharophilus]